MYRDQRAPGTASTVCYTSCMYCTLVLGSSMHTEWRLCASFIHTMSLSMAKAASVFPQNNKHIGFCPLQQYRARFGMLLLQPVPSPSRCPTASLACFLRVHLPPSGQPLAKPLFLVFLLPVSVQPFIISA